MTRIKENEVRLIELEKMINPLLDEDDIVGFSYILADIVQQCKNLPKSAVFHTKVDPRKVGNTLYSFYCLRKCLIRKTQQKQTNNEKTNITQFSILTIIK